jgi:hypothetical protein
MPLRAHHFLLASSKFTDLRPRTKADYQQSLTIQSLAPAPLNGLTPGWVPRLRERAYAKHKRRFVNYMLAVLSVVLKHGIQQQLIASNPVTNVKKIRRPKGWPAPIHLEVPIGLATYTGLRKGDALTFTWSGYRDGMIATNTSKAGAATWWPCLTKLAVILAEARRGDAVQIALTTRGTPWTESGSGRRGARSSYGWRNRARCKPDSPFTGCAT